MTWFVSHPSRYRHALNELPKQRDRGAAIIATAILEEHLLEAIESRIERHDHTENKMFKNDGALSSFSARIDFGLLLGLYQEAIQRRMHLVRKMRNRFAHNMEPTSFKSMSGDCAKLNPKVGSHRTFNKLLDPLFAQDPTKRFKLTMFHRSTNPRTQFIRGVQQVCALLSVQIIFAGMPGPWEKLAGRAPQPSPDKSEQPAALLTRT